MEELILRDQEEFPTEEVVYSYIGDAKALWHSLFKYLHVSHPNLTEQWRILQRRQELADEGCTEVQDDILAFCHPGRI